MLAWQTAWLPRGFAEGGRAPGWAWAAKPPGPVPSMVKFGRVHTARAAWDEPEYSVRHSHRFSRSKGQLLRRGACPLRHCTWGCTGPARNDRPTCSPPPAPTPAAADHPATAPSPPGRELQLPHGAARRPPAEPHAPGCLQQLARGEPGGWGCSPRLLTGAAHRDCSPGLLTGAAQRGCSKGLAPPSARLQRRAPPRDPHTACLAAGLGLDSTPRSSPPNAPRPERH
jgi:hypothetical protein